MNLRWTGVFGIAFMIPMIGLGGCAQPSSRDVVTVASQAPATRGPDGPDGPDGSLTNTLRWTTASEVDNFGFDVFRGDSPDGPFVCLTDRPVAGAGTADVPNDYAYVDTTIDPEREYFYYVESISMDGNRLRFTPIMRSPAKK